MAKIVARNAAFAVDDSSKTLRAISGATNNITMTYSAEAPEVTAFGNNNRQRLSDGIKDVEFTIDAFYDSAADFVDVVLYGIVGGSTIVTFGPSGSAGSSIKYTTCAICTNYEMTFGVEDSAKVSATFVNRSGSLTRTTY